MADTSDPTNKKEDDDFPESLLVPEKSKLSGCSTVAAVLVAIFVLLIVVGFGLFVGACWR